MSDSTWGSMHVLQRYILGVGITVLPHPAMELCIAKQWKIYSPYRKPTALLAIAYLVQVVGPSAGGHHAPGAGVDDLNFAVAHDVVHVPPVQLPSAQRRYYVRPHRRGRLPQIIDVRRSALALRLWEVLSQLHYSSAWKLYLDMTVS